jgi:hypothetical protein
MNTIDSMKRYNPNYTVSASAPSIDNDFCWNRQQIGPRDRRNLRPRLVAVTSRVCQAAASTNDLTFLHRNTTFTNTTRSTPSSTMKNPGLTLTLVALLSCLGHSLAANNEEQYGTGLSLSSGYGSPCPNPRQTEHELTPASQNYKRLFPQRQFRRHRKARRRRGVQSLHARRTTQTG